MKKNILLLGTLGVAAGVLYVLESDWRKPKGNGNATNAHSGEESERPPTPQVPSASSPETRKSNGVTGQGASMARIVKENVDEAQPAIDDQGTDQFEASQLLKNIRDNAFDASDEKLALALGRPTEEIEQWTSGIGTIDGDVIMKARALALQRGLEVE